MSAQLVDHRLGFVFAGDIIDADRRASVPEGQTQSSGQFPSSRR